MTRPPLALRLLAFPVLYPVRCWGRSLDWRYDLLFPWSFSHDFLPCLRFALVGFGLGADADRWGI
jgi:hypothetical protein